MKLKTRLDYKHRRHLRLRQLVKGSASRPRMSVCITNKHMYIQFIDDEHGHTISSFSTAGLKLKNINLAAAKDAARKAADAAIAKGIKQVVFDRGGKSYGGRIKVVADVAREAGIKL